MGERGDVGADRPDGLAGEGLGFEARVDACRGADDAVHEARESRLHHLDAARGGGAVADRDPVKRDCPERR